MSPIDNHLRDSLTQHAADVSEDYDRFAAVERRAHAMHRRRLAWVGAATAVVLAGGVVGGVTLLGSDRDTLQVPVGDGSSETPTAPPTPSPSPLAGDLSGDQPPPADGYLDWPYRSGEGTAALDLAASIHPLWAGELPTGTMVVVGQHVDDAGHLRAYASVTEPGSDPYEIEGARLRPGTTQEVSFVLPGDAYPWVLVIGAPTTGQILYRDQPGGTFEPVDTTEGWAVFKRTGAGDDRILVEDGDGLEGEDLYYGPIDTGPSEPDV